MGSVPALGIEFNAGYYLPASIGFPVDFTINRTAAHDGNGRDLAVRSHKHYVGIVAESKVLSVRQPLGCFQGIVNHFLIAGVDIYNVMLAARVLDQECATRVPAGTGPEALASCQIGSNRIRHLRKAGIAGELSVHIIEFAFSFVEKCHIALLNRIRVADIGRSEYIGRDAAVAGYVEDVVGVADIEPQLAVDLRRGHYLAVVDKVVDFEGGFFETVEQGPVLLGHREGKGIQGKQMLIGAHKDEGFVIYRAVRPHYRQQSIDLAVKGLFVCQRKDVPGIARGVARIAVSYKFIGQKVEIAGHSAVTGMGNQHPFSQRRIHEHEATDGLGQAALGVGSRK